jgi:hypothetical protein
MNTINKQSWAVVSQGSLSLQPAAFAPNCLLANDRWAGQQPAIAAENVGLKGKSQ